MLSRRYVQAPAQASATEIFAGECVGSWPETFFRGLRLFGQVCRFVRADRATGQAGGVHGCTIS
jgi:hypothetical protein